MTRIGISIVATSREDEKKAHGVSLNGPFFCRPSALRTAMVITTSSGFLVCKAATPVGTLVRWAVSCLMRSIVRLSSNEDAGCWCLFAPTLEFSFTLFAMTALLPPAAQPRRGDQNLQPVGIIPLRSLSSLLKFSTQHYFTSTLFVEPMRADISDLLKAYIERCKVALNAKEDPKPFEWFKTIWRERKWNLLHLRCIQPRPRKAFLEVTTRLFLGISKHVLSSY